MSCTTLRGHEDKNSRISKGLRSPDSSECRNTKIIFCNIELGSMLSATMCNSKVEETSQFRAILNKNYFVRNRRKSDRKPVVKWWWRPYILCCAAISHQETITFINSRLTVQPAEKKQKQLYIMSVAYHLTGAIVISHLYWNMEPRHSCCPVNPPASISTGYK